MSLRSLAASTFVAATSLVTASSLAFARAAYASDDDGAYGRLDGDLAIHAGSGVAVMSGGPHLAFQVELLYLSTAGVYARYTDALGQKKSVFERSVSTGVEVRPLFLGRYAKNFEQGPARLDLFLDSFSIEVGAVWGQPQKQSVPTLPGLEFGLGAEFPLLTKASGPFIGTYGALRLTDLAGHDDRGLGKQGSMLLFTFSWHQMVRAHLVDASDRLSR